MAEPDDRGEQLQPANPFQYDLISNRRLFTWAAVKDATVTKAKTVRWCMDAGLFAREMLCPSCGQKMVLYLQSERWRYDLSACRRELSLRKNSFFQQTRLSLNKAIELMYHWAAGNSVTVVQQMTKVSRKTATQWYEHCMTVCVNEMERCPVLIGGLGHVVEIEEISLKKKSKYGRGTQHENCWLFGGIDKTTNKWLGVIVGQRRTQDVLFPLIIKHIKAGTLIMSDKYATYVTADGTHNLINHPALVEQGGYGHLWVNHSENFVDPRTGAHTQRIEGAREVRLKGKIKARRGMLQTRREKFLQESLWRSCFFRREASFA